MKAKFYGQNKIHNFVYQKFTCSILTFKSDFLLFQKVDHVEVKGSLERQPLKENDTLIIFQGQATM